MKPVWKIEILSLFYAVVFNSVAISAAAYSSFTVHQFTFPLLY